MPVPERSSASSTERRIVRVRGTVQGIGFRPFVFRVAEELALAGAVWNDSDGVVIDAEGDAAALDALLRRIRHAPPPHALIEEIAVANHAPTGVTGFRIDDSVGDSLDATPSAARVSADLATCDACLAELFDPGDRRHRYPFINCTACGPRYSIIRDVPYDRPHTTMASFAMCEACEAEYRDPRSRRFHAQPNACPACGPTLRFGAPAIAVGGPALDAAVGALRRGEIVAIKGLGGFLLACDARSREAVSRLRARKQRWAKPLAVMFADLDTLACVAELGPSARAMLTSARQPIVLVPVRRGAALVPELCQGLDELGAMLPYTPLHHLLLREVGGPLVMTSGNLADEPIAIDDDDAHARLGSIADHFLLHDRPIHMRVDDSVVRVDAGGERVLRRARGFAPEAIDLGFAVAAGPAVLAVGADLKNVFCLTAGRTAIASQHIGDLASYEGQRFFAETRANLERLFQVTPTHVAHDLHPGYHSTAIARRTGLPAIAVQHHHAHIASVLVEHARHDRVIGVAWDGTGYGPDGTAWGGEILVADLARFERVGRLRPVALPGGDAAVRQPWRMALSHLVSAELPTSRIAHADRAPIEAMVRARAHVVMTSSAGRLFDAVAYLLGLGELARYEGEAAMRLECASTATAGPPEPYPMPILDGDPFDLDPRPLITAIVAALDHDRPIAEIGGRFHATLADAITRACVRVRAATGLTTVAISGGCFQNRLLSRLAVGGLRAAGFDVLANSRFPAGDGGIALGQAAVAAWRLGHVPCDPR